MNSPLKAKWKKYTPSIQQRGFPTVGRYRVVDGVVEIEMKRAPKRKRKAKRR